MRYNLLKMVQLILDSMDSDEVSDVDETVESRQVVSVIEQTFNDLASQIDFPDMWDLFELQPSGDVTRPTLMYIPEDVAKVEWIRYDATPAGETTADYQTVWPMSRLAFFQGMDHIDTSDPDRYSYDLLVGAETFNIRGRSDKAPEYYTTADSHTLIFDSFDLAEGSTLVGNKTQCYGMKIPAFSRTNDFTPPFEPRQFTLFFNEAKSQCFLELKQVENAKAEQRARRGWIHSQRKKKNTDASPVISDFTQKASFGRKGRRGW